MDLAPPLDGAAIEPFVAVSWEEALQLTADELSRIRGQHGNESIYAGSLRVGQRGTFPSRAK